MINSLILNINNTESGKNKLKIISVIFSYSLYTYLFFLLFNHTDQRISALSLFPVIAVALFFGMRAGVLSSLFIIIINTIYIQLLGLPALNIMIQNIPGALGTVSIAAALGYLHDIQNKYRYQLKIVEQEITERKKAEEKLFKIQNTFQSGLQNRDNRLLFPLSLGNDSNNIPQKIFREIAENAADIIYNVNLEGYFIYVNKIGLNTTGFSLDELMKLKYTDLAAPAYKNIVKLFYLKQYLKKELNTYFEFPLLIKDGSIKWFGQNSTLIIEGEKVTGFNFIARDITERKKIEDDLKESEEILRSITSMANDAIISIDGNFKIIQWNRSAERMYGYFESEILGKSLKEIVPPRERDSFDIIIKKENRMEGIDSAKIIERRGYKKDGSVFPIEISVAEWKKGNQTFYTHIIRDVTKRKDIEQKIKQSEKDYRMLFENAHEPILLIQPEDEVILEANESACRIYGFDRSELIGMSLKSLSQDVRNGEEKILETLTKGNFIEFQTTHFNKNGKELYFEVYASTTEYRGEYVIILLNRDVTERILAEIKLDDYRNQLEKLVEERTEKLKETNKNLFVKIQKLIEVDLKIQNQVEFFKTLINTIPIPVFVKDRNNLYSDCNKAFIDFFGINKDDILGRKKINLASEEEKELFENNIIETNVVDKDGKIHEIIIYRAVLLRKDNTIEGYVGVMLDITQQKKMQEEIKKALEAEKELSALKSRFVSTTSHEFRTPLTTILASAELLLRYFNKWNEEKKISVISRIQNSAEYMNGLISDVLTLNRSDSGRITFNPQVTELVNLCSSIVEEIKLAAKPEHRIEFYHSQPEMTGSFDPVLVRQFVSNLLSNAVKYSPSGGNIILSVIKNEDDVIFEVKDYGIGISPEDHQNLFQPFFRGANISNIPGTGLGLSILKKAVELHKGKFEFESKMNYGSTFKIIIPFDK